MKINHILLVVISFHFVNAQDPTVICDIPDGIVCPFREDACTSPLARTVCPHKCGYCGSTVQPPVTESCVDNIGNGVTCEEIPNFCANPYAEIVCRKTCGFCGSGVSTSLPPLTEPPENCVDNVIRSPTCEMMPGICVDLLASVWICRQTCNKCSLQHSTDSGLEGMTTGDLEEVTTTSDTGVGITTTSDTGVGITTTSDTGVGVTTTSDTGVGITSTSDTGVGVTTTSDTGVGITTTSDTGVGVTTTSDTGVGITTTSETGVGVTSTTDTGVEEITTVSTTITTELNTATLPANCLDIAEPSYCAVPDFCHEPSARYICRRTCSYCECEDHVRGMTCEELENEHGVDPCNDSLGQAVCQLFCNLC